MWSHWHAVMALQTQLAIARSFMCDAVLIEERIFKIISVFLDGRWRFWKWIYETWY